MNMSDLLELHLFTNINNNIRKRLTIKDTYLSFVKKFGKYKTTIWLNPLPNDDSEVFDWYLSYLKKEFPRVKINLTKSHAEGWIRAVEESTTPYVFMLEHDWEFTDKVTHSIEEICEDMRLDNIIHYRFHKKSIQKLYSDRQWGLESRFPDQGKNTKYFRTRSLSNLPGIIDKSLYTRFFITMLKQANKNRVGRGGIEQNLIHVQEKMPELKDYKFVIYGDNFYFEKSVNHLNARKHEKRIYRDANGVIHEDYI